MTTMNDEWSRCPICFEDYSLTHRPTTFACGHSTCIGHVSGARPLRQCPICRCLLGQGKDYHVSYNLEEAARLFHAIKHTIDWSKMTLPSSSETDNDDSTSASAILRRDEVYARRLQAELNHQPAQQAQEQVAAPAQSDHRSRDKRCGHRCDLLTTVRCCTCSDRRPHRLGNTYEGYIDGRGRANCLPRNEHYCSTCKRQ